MSKIKIILIEDEIFINDLYKRMLEKGGYQVVSALNGQTGLQMCLDNPDAQLILLDIMLPKLHGIDVLRKIKQESKTKEIPVVLLSNLGEEKIITDALAIGARDYIKKVHLDPLHLTDCVSKYLNNPRYKYATDTT
jgi:DNA-binding response OmpR family regulator